jgi:hypothetical protein
VTLALLCFAAGLFLPSGENSAQELALFEAFSRKLASDEEIARKCEISFQALHVMTANDGRHPIRFQRGSLAQRGAYERWTRYTCDDRPRLKEAFPEQDLGLVNFALAAGKLDLDSIRPTYSIADGGRIFTFGPIANDRRGWLGAMGIKMETAIRDGALNCGLLFGEEYLYTYLKRHRLNKVQQENGYTTFVLVPNTEQANADEVELIVDNKDVVSKITWYRAREVVGSALVTRTANVAGRTLVAGGRIFYNYKPQIDVVAELSFVVGEVPVDEAALLTLPPEIRRVDGIILYRDEAANVFRAIGNEELKGTYLAKLDSKPQSATHSGDDGKIVGTQQKAIHSGSAGGEERIAVNALNWFYWRVALIGFGVVGLALIVLGIMKTRK